MLDRQKKLNAVYEHLHNSHNIHTKGEFADSIKYARAYISSALNGNERNGNNKESGIIVALFCSCSPSVQAVRFCPLRTSSRQVRRPLQIVKGKGR